MLHCAHNINAECIYYVQTDLLGSWVAAAQDGGGGRR